MTSTRTLAVAGLFLLLAACDPEGGTDPGRLQLSPTHGRPASAAPAVEIFSSPSCQYCVMAKDWFRQKGVAFVEYNVTRDNVAASRMYPANPRGILPFVLIRGRPVIGFVPEEYDRLLRRADS
jgi:glutaredoxin